MIFEKQDKLEVIYLLRFQYDVIDLIKVFCIARSCYYYYLKNRDKEDKYKYIKEYIKCIYDKHNGNYGYRRIHQELVNNGVKINRKVVQRLMKGLGLICKVREKSPKYSNGNENFVFSNIMSGNFFATIPNEKWVTDVTEFRVCGKRLYLSPILDLYNGEIISFSVSDKNNFCLILDMLNKAFNKVGDVSGLILHSDQGSLYSSKNYHNLLRDKGIVQSMSRRGNCYDNAVIENFFGHLKSEMFHKKKFESVEDFISKLNSYIYYYNNKRIKTKLKMSPVEYRTRNSIA